MIKKGGYQSRQNVSANSYGSGYGSGGYGGFNTYPERRPQPKRVESSMVSNAKTNYLELNKGDMVLHAAFGRGMVLSVMKMGGDALLEIAFDDIGTKKLMAKTASAHMKKL